MVMWPQLEQTGASPMFSFKAESTIAADPARTASVVLTAVAPPPASPARPPPGGEMRPVEEGDGSLHRLDVILCDRVGEVELDPCFHCHTRGRLGKLHVAVGRDLGQLVPLQVLDAEGPEHVVHDRVGHLDVGMALDHAPRLEASGR